ncbi:MAG: hypothetical protein ACETWE_02365 [Candidatus Bathyarchaeia archaeon]
MVRPLFRFPVEESDRVNALVLLPFLVLIAPILPALIEIFRRKDKGPREIPEQTLYEEQAGISETIPRLEKTRARARVKIAGEVIRIVGDVSIPSGVEINENIVVHGNLTLGSKCHVQGSLKSLGQVEVGDDSVIEGHIISDGKVTVGRNTRVEGIIDSSGDIILSEDAVVGAVSSGKSVRLAQGAKINRRVPAEELITEPSLVPSTEEEETQAERPFEVTIPSFSAFFDDRRYQATSDDKARIFQSLRDEMRRIYKPEEKPIDEGTLKELSQREAEIFKLAVSGYDTDEIGLRLLMDPVSVQKAIDSLIKAGYLDEYLKPLRPRAAGEEASVTSPPRKEQEKLEVEQFRVGVVFERLLASKLRQEVKEGSESEEKGRTSTRNEMEKRLKEWQRESSVFFGPRETEKERVLSDAGELEQARKDDLKLPDNLATDAREQRKDLEGASKSKHGKRLGSTLPFLTLVAILLSEVAYYSPSLSIFAFLESVMPSAVKAWMLFLGIALALAITTGLYIAKMLSSPRLKIG